MLLLMETAASGGNKGGVVGTSVSSFGVVASDGVPDLEVLRASELPLLFKGSAEC